MWWSRGARIPGGVVLTVILSLAACGFTPVYGPGGAAEGLYGQIRVAAPRDPAGYRLVDQLERRLGLPRGDTAYDLTAAIRLDEDGIGITPDQETTRIRLRGRVDYRLTDSATGATRAAGQVSNFTSYSAPVFSVGRASGAGNAVTVRAAEEDALARLMVILADQIVAELLAASPDWRVAQ